ncbi:hypothetical protein D3C87_1974780 [compost metagenome]
MLEFSIADVQTGLFDQPQVQCHLLLLDNLVAASHDEEKQGQHGQCRGADDPPYLFPDPIDLAPEAVGLFIEFAHRDDFPGA